MLKLRQYLGLIQKFLTYRNQSFPIDKPSAPSEFLLVGTSAVSDVMRT